MIWRLRDIEIDDMRFEVRRGGRRLPIAPTPLRLLVHLARRYPAGVDRDELLRTLWPDVRVTAASVVRAVRDVRRALGDAEYSDVIRTVRGRGYTLGDAPTLLAASSDRGDGPIAALIGRAGELARLEGGLARAARGCGSLAAIGGEPGIGKTTLANEIVSRARQNDMLALAGICREDTGAPPCWPWPEVLDRLTEQYGESAVRSLGAAARDLGPVAQRLRETAAAGSRASLATSDADARFRLAQAMTTLLREAALIRPLVVLFEDLHWASAATIQLLQFVARAIADVPLFLIVTYRTAGAPRNVALQAALPDLEGLAHGLAEIRLTGFTPEDVAAYVRGATGSPPETELVRRLHDTTAGNPLFLRGLVPLMLASESDSAMRIPATVAHVLRQQYRWLSPPARAMIELAAVIGPEGPVRLLARASGRTREAVMRYLAEAEGQHLVRVVEDRSFRFTHDLVRAALYEGLATRRRAEMHRRIGQALAALHGGGEGPHLPDVAHHFVAALPSVEPDKAIRLARRASERARRNLDFDGAARHCRAALRALEYRERDAPRMRCDLLLELGALLNLDGNPIGSREPLLVAAGLAKQLRSPARLARAALTMGAWPQIAMEDPFVTRTVEDALAQDGRQRPATRARLLALLATLRSIAGSAAESARLVDDALALSRRLRAPSLISEVLLQRQVILQTGVPGDHATRLDLSDEALAAARRAGRVDAILLCRRLRIGLLLELGAARRLEDEVEAFRRESASARCRGHYAAAFRAMRALLSGCFADAHIAIDEAERLADPLSPEERWFTPTSQRYALPVEAPRRAVLVETIRGFLVDFPSMTSWRGPLTRLLVDLGQEDAARAELRALAVNDFAAIKRNVSYVVVLATLSDVSWRLQEVGYARRLYELLLPHAGTHASAGLGIIYEGPVDYSLAILSAVLGRRQESERHFRRALAATTRLGARPWYTRTQTAYAALLSSGRSDERRRARELAGAAAETAARLGMHGVHREAERLRQGSRSVA